VHWIRPWSKDGGLTDKQFGEIRQTLAAGWPVCAGSDHSRLLVGYVDDAKQPGGGLFITRDSGLGDYGTVSYEWVRKHVYDLFWVELPDKAAEKRAADWAVPASAYRVEVTIEPGMSRRVNCPVGVEIDFAKVFKDEQIPGRLDRHSIRVVQVDPVSMRVVPQDAGGKQIEVPHQLTGDFPNDDAGRVWWRMRDERATHFHIYFDSLSDRAKEPPARVGLIGIGDSFHYNNGQPNLAPVHPLHSQFWHIDCDGDGRRDLIGFAYRRYEFGSPLEKNMGNGVFFLKNVGTPQKPLFAPKFRLKGDDGQYLQTDLLPQNMFPVDWNNDERTDFIGVDSRKNLLLWENTGTRDRNGLFVLKQPRVLTALSGVSEFREKTAGVIRKPSFYIRAINPVDWNGDGGRDLVVSWQNTNILQAVDSKKGVIPYGAPLQFFELLEDVSTEKSDKPTFAPPRVITEERGLPLNAATYATGGVTYIDWDGGGDNDLLFHDVTNRPIDGGRLMFSENVGSRDKPILMMPVPILKIDDSPQIVDWNNDGLLDLIAGGEFFENTNRLTGGSADRPARGTTPAGTRKPHAWSYPKLVSRGPALQTQPEMLGHWATSVDWNGDGTLDFVRGMTSHVQVFFNRGSNLHPTFDPGVNLQAGGQAIVLPNWLDLNADPPVDRGPQGLGEAEHSWLNPTVGDFDGDGDLDLFITSQRWQTLYFENTGTRTAPVLAKGRELRFQGNPHEFSWRSKISVGDLDADSNPEIVVTSDQDNIFYAYRPAAAQPDPGELECDSRWPLLLEDNEPVKGWHGGQNNNGDNHSLLVDWDNDGDLDLINGTLWNIYYYENVGTRQKPLFKAHGKMKAGGEDLFVFRHAGSVDAADWNGDGRLDLVVSTENPSDQPLGEILHLFDRAFLDNDLPMGTLGRLEKRE